MVQETGIQSQVESYQRLKKWYLMLPCLALTITWLGLRVNECSGYDTKQSDGEVPAVLELWGMWSTPSLPLLPGPLWPGVLALDKALSMG